MKTAGVVLDFYDDMAMALLKESFPTSDSLPEIVKTAHILSSEERDVLRDEAFALVLVNEGKVLRKFACVDAGNTLLSAMYFMQNKESLPEEAQKIASANIQAACQEFGLPLRDIEKIAAQHRGMNPKGTTKGVARTRDSMLEPIAGDESNWAERTNLVSVSGGQDAGRVGSTAGQMKTAGEDSEYDLPDKKAKKGKFVTTKAHGDARKKIADRERAEQKGGINLDSFHKLNPEAKPPVKKEKDSNAVMGYGPPPVAASMPKMAHYQDSVGENGLTEMEEMNMEREALKKKVPNQVDVSSFEAPLRIVKKAAQHLALDRFPLDSYSDVKKAVEYFDENYLQMPPEDRHAFAVKTASRAEDLDIEFGHMLERYGSVEYAVDVDAHLASRRAIAPDFVATWNDLREKRASLTPDAFVQLLVEADKKASLNWEYGGEVEDAYYATFGGNKKKEAYAAWSWKGGLNGELVNADQLMRLARNGHGLIKKQFDGDLARAFAKDPITIFESLPETHKVIMSRLANQEFDGLPTN